MIQGGKTMQKTFQLLRRGDLEAVRQILDKKPEEVNAVSGDKPKRDQGQSLLQVAIKSGHLDIADLLIDRGADLNFIEGLYGQHFLPTLISSGKPALFWETHRS